MKKFFAAIIRFFSLSKGEEIVAGYKERNVYNQTRNL
jgi:hypothetical protein